MPYSYHFEPFPSFPMHETLKSPRLYLLYREKSNAPERERRKSRSRDVTFEASAGSEELWKCFLAPEWSTISHDGSMYAIYGNIYHQYTPNVSIYIIHGSYGYGEHGMVSSCSMRWEKKQGKGVLFGSMHKAS